MRRLLLFFVFLFIFSCYNCFSISIDNFSVKVSPNTGIISLLINTHFPESYCNKTILLQGLNNIISGSFDHNYTIHILSYKIENHKCNVSALINIKTNITKTNNYIKLEIEWKDDTFCFNGTKIYITVPKTFEIEEIYFNNRTLIHSKNITISYILDIIKLKYGNKQNNILINIPKLTTNCWQFRGIKVKRIKVTISSNQIIKTYQLKNQTSLQTTSEITNKIYKKKLIAIIILIVIIVVLVIYYLKVVRR